MINETSSCVHLAWSPDTADEIKPSFYVCVIALLFHSVFWFLIFAYSSLRQWKSMQWLYAFLFVDLVLLLRFFILYGLRHSSACVTIIFGSFICYFDSVGNIYLNFLQSFILLALNVSRHMQITRGGADIYLSHRRLMFAMHCLIYLLPLLVLIVEIHIGWAVSYRRSGGSCDLSFPLISTRVLNTIFGYCFPVLLTFLFLFRSLHYVSSTVATMNTPQIIDARRKHHRLLVLESVVFYSVWLLLWSPHIILSQYTDVSSSIKAITQALNYIELTSDPIIITALDVRFLKAWKKSFRRIRARVAPTGNP